MATMIILPAAVETVASPLNRRAELRRQWQAAHAEHESRLARLRRELDAADQDLATTRTLVLEAERFRGEAADALESARLQVTHARDLYERAMLDLPDPDVEAFLSWLDEQKAQVSKSVRYGRETRVLSLRSMKRSAFEVSNLDDVQNCLRQLTAIGFTVASFQSNPPEDVPAALADYRRQVVAAVKAL